MSAIRTLFRSLSVVTIMGLGVLASGGDGARAQDVTLKLHYFLPEQAIVPRMGLKVWSDKVETESGGRIRIQHYPSMQLGGTPPELADQVLDGVADIIWTLPGYTPGRFPSTEVFELPFIASGAEATSRAFWEMSERHSLEVEFTGMRILALWVHGPGVIHSIDPVKLPEDLTGVKMRAPTRMTTTYFRNLGAAPIGMPVPAVPEALSRGMIRAAALPWEVTPSLKLSELVRSHTEFPDTLYVSTFILAMNQSVYDRLPEDLRKVIDDNSGMEPSAFFGRVMEEGDEIGRQTAVDAGNDFIKLDEEQERYWRKAGDVTRADWIKEMRGRGVDGQALISQVEELIAKYDAQKEGQ